MQNEIKGCIYEIIKEIKWINIFPIMFITTLFILIMPENVLTFLWLSNMNDTLKNIIGIVFILSFVCCVVLYIPILKKKNKENEYQNEKTYYLTHQLQEVENGMIVKYFYSQESKTFHPTVFIPSESSGLLCGLRDLEIVSCKSWQPDEFDRYKYSLDDDVLKYLNSKSKRNKIKVKDGLMIIKK